MEESSEGDLAIVHFRANSGANLNDFRTPSEASNRSRTQSVIFLDKVTPVDGDNAQNRPPSRTNSVDSDNNDRLSNPLLDAPTKVVSYADNELLARGKIAIKDVLV